MKISELIVKLEAIERDHGDLPVALMTTMDNYPFDGLTTEYESCKGDYLNVDNIKFEDSVYDPNAEAPRKWTKIDRSGCYLVIGAT